MSITPPQIPKDPTLIDDFAAYAQNFLAEELPICEIEISKEEVEGAEFNRIEIRESFFKNCTFRSCNFEKASFIDVIFQNCDLSGCKFSGAYFERCRFVSCKGIGLDMSDTIVKQTAFEQSNLQYTYFYKAKLLDILFEQVDFTEASLTESELKRFTTTNSRFVKTNFFKTRLATIDFTDNEFIAPIVSTPPVELKGVIVDIYQAANLMTLWGVVVRS